MQEQSKQDLLKPLSEADLDALFAPCTTAEQASSEAVNVGRSYYGNEWDKKK
ncbi:MAG: hypothetical protein ACRCTU_01950 [Zoogloea sp.]|uniref:hypothetical protein n=1 Tax=Zoogloea sp. TaxID=49181 RepID=UPI003F2BACAC